jgi:hypothetical protein
LCQNRLGTAQLVKLPSKNNVMSLRSTLVCLVVLVFTGCVRYTKTVDYDETPADDAAYLYGRFELRSSRDHWRLGGHVTMGFRVECSSKEFYTIRFMVTKPLQVIRITPAACRMTEVVFTTSSGEIVGRKPIPPELIRNERFNAGKAYYIGDFYGTTDESHLETNWKVSEVRHDYESTTRMLKSWLPGFARIPTEDRMLMSVEPGHDPARGSYPFPM